MYLASPRRAVPRRATPRQASPGLEHAHSTTGFAVSVSASPFVECQLSGSAGAWTDVTADVRLAQPIRAIYGISGDGPTDRVAQTGTLAFSLDNSQANSGSLLGYYSPDHANARLGFDNGTPVRFGAVYSGSTFYKSICSLDTIEPLPGKYRERYTSCQAVDWLDDAAKYKLRLLEVQLNKRADQNIATIVGAMTKKPPASALATGQDIFPYSLDTSKDETTTAMAEFAKSVMSELGFLYMAAGSLVFDDRHARLKTTTSSASLSDTMVAMRASRERAKIFNRVKTTTHPREVDSAASILYTLQGKPLVNSSASLVMTGAYTDPTQRGSVRVGGASMITPASTTDFLMNSASDGSGTDLTANFGVSASYGGNSVRYSIFNGGGTAGYVTQLQARGIGIYTKEPTVSEKQDQTSIEAYGEAVLEFDMPYQSSVLVGDDAANSLLATQKDPATRINEIELIGNRSDELMLAGLRTEPGDRVTIVETATGINKSFYVNGCEVSVEAGNLWRFIWHVTPAETSTYWILGIANYSELGQTTILGY